MNVKVAPYGDRILVERKEVETKTAGGILLPDAGKEKPMQGTVIAVGDGARNDKGEFMKMNLQAGDVIFFAKFGGTEIKIDGKEYLILAERDVIAKVI